MQSAESLDASTPPSWALSSHVRRLKPESAKKYKNALKEFRSFLTREKLPDKYLPGHCDFELPPVELLRRFVHSFANGRTGKIKKEPRTTTACSKISSLTRAIEVLTGQTYDDHVIQDVHEYVRYSLVNESLVSNKAKFKFDFDRRDVENTHEVLWTRLDPSCNSARKVRSGRYIAFLSAMLYMFAAYGSRISALIPKSQTERSTSIDELWLSLKPAQNESGSDTKVSHASTHTIVGDMISGIRYKDLQVLLMRRDGSEEVEVVITLAQRFFKNHVNPKEDAMISWGILRSDFLRDYIPYVLAFAFAENAFKKFPDPASLLTYKMKDSLDCETCEWREELRDVHIFRETIDSKKPYSQYQWDNGLQLATKQAGYTETITVHRIRQSTTQKVNASGITAAQHRHLFGQKVRTFEEQYMNEHTSIDAQGIVSGEILRPDIAQKLRSARRTVCRGIPTVLTPGQHDNVLETDTQLLELEAEWTSAVSREDDQSAQNIYARIKYRRKQAFKERLEVEQQLYYRDQLSAAQGDELDISNISQQRWVRLMQFQPQHARVAEMLIADHQPDPVERVALLNNLVDLVRQEAPTMNGCIHEHYRKPLKDEHKDKFQGTYRNEKSKFEQQNGCLAKYCFLCLQWLAATEMDSHLNTKHLSDLPVDCGTFYLQSERRGQLVNPGLCPFCLGDEQLPIQDRFCFFTARRQHVLHLQDHLRLASNDQIECPHPNCVTTHSTESLVQHLEVIHGIDHFEYQLVPKKTGIKRKRTEDEVEVNVDPSLFDQFLFEPFLFDPSLPLCEDDDWLAPLDVTELPQNLMKTTSNSIGFMMKTKRSKKPAGKQSKQRGRRLVGRRC